MAPVQVMKMSVFLSGRNEEARLEITGVPSRQIRMSKAEIPLWGAPHMDSVTVSEDGQVWL